MTSDIRTVFVRRALFALDAGNIRTARSFLEAVAGPEPTPVVLSCLGYCLAHEERDLDRAFSLCRNALRREPANPLHHLNLGRVHLLAGNKPLAVKAFRKGLGFGRHQKLIDELESLGMRRPLFFPALCRNHLLNRTCGFVFSRLNLRGIFHRPEKFRMHHR